MYGLKIRPQANVMASIKSLEFSKILRITTMMLLKILIFLIGDALCFPNALAQNRRQTMQQVHNELQNDLQKEIKVFHFPIQTEFKPILKPQRLAAILI